MTREEIHELPWKAQEYINELERRLYYTKKSEVKTKQLNDRNNNNKRINSINNNSRRVNNSKQNTKLYGQVTESVKPTFKGRVQ